MPTVGFGRFLQSVQNHFLAGKPSKSMSNGVNASEYSASKRKVLGHREDGSLILGERIPLQRTDESDEEYADRIDE